MPRGQEPGGKAWLVASVPGGGTLEHMVLHFESVNWGPGGVWAASPCSLVLVA